MFCDELRRFDLNLYNRWKAAITDDMQQSRDPHRPSAVFRSFANFIFGTNETDLSKVLPMEAGERRFVAFLVSSAISSKSEAEKTAYFARLLAADVRPLARYLMTHPTIRRGEPFLTDATFQAKVDSLDSFELWWYSCLREAVVRSQKKEKERDVFSWLELAHLQNTSRAMKERVYACYLEFGRGNKLNSSVFWKQMNRFNAGDSTARSHENIRFIEFNTLAQCRSAFVVKMGAQLPWFSSADDKKVAEEAAAVLEQFARNPVAATNNPIMDFVNLLPSDEEVRAQMGIAPAPAPAPAPAALPPKFARAFDYDSGASDMEDEAECTLNQDNLDDLKHLVLSPADARNQLVKMPIGEGDESDMD